MTQKNQLQFETSPYLLQHADNPVHWQPWGGAALELARKQNKPILLSIGYSACHWCHVMAHESFEDDQVAALMNHHFVNIKVDREERPDLDYIYQNALAMIGQAGGWPLTMFCTAEGYPFFGGTYFPPTSRFGRPGFADMLRNVAAIWRDEPEKIHSNVEALKQGLQTLATNLSADPGAVQLSTLDQFAAKLLALIDLEDGGIRGAPKFPSTGQLEVLWRGYLRSGNEEMKQAVTLSLQHMAQGGIYDHLGGGFARYSVDDRWLVPHFEKMLYDNAQLVRLMALVWQDTGDPLLAQRIEETIDWLFREMRGEEVDGCCGFASTIDADSEGQEGKFYVWNKQEIDAILDGDQRGLFAEVYDVSAAGNWEGQVILNRLSHLKLLAADREAMLAQARAKLFEARERRVRPGWDDKILADWNGLMIHALAQAGRVLGRNDWIAAARDAFRFVTTVMMQPDGRLFHSWRQQKPHHIAMLEDYANMMLAALVLYEVTAVESYLTQAQAWITILDRDFADVDHGGYFQTSRHARDVCVRTKPIFDQAVPSGNGVMADVLARLMILDPEGDWAGRLMRHMGTFAGQMENNMFGLPSFLNGVETGLRTRHVHTEGPDGNDLVRVIQTFSAPDLVWTNKHRERPPQAIVCQAGVCLPIIHKAQELAHILDRK